jgi:hypothetical protein
VFLEKQAKLDFYANRYAQIISLLNMTKDPATIKTLKDAAAVMNVQLQTIVSDMKDLAKQSSKDCSNYVNKILNEIPQLQKEYKVLVDQQKTIDDLNHAVQDRNIRNNGYGILYDGIIVTIAAAAALATFLAM